MSIEVYLDKWGLIGPKKIAQTRTSDVFLVELQGHLAVLKLLTEIGKKDEARGAIALRYFKGQGAVRLLNADEGAHLLTYADGKNLKELVSNGRDQEATEVICQVARKLHESEKGSVNDLKRLDENFRSLFERASLKDSSAIFLKAARCASDLLNTESNTVVLHGDLHHTNIIHSSNDGWVSIDPKGLYGEASYDFANIFYNPDDLPNVVELSSRISSLSNSFSKVFEIDPKRILRFAFAFGCLSAAWAIEDGLDPSRRLRIAKIIESQL